MSMIEILIFLINENLKLQFFYIKKNNLFIYISKIILFIINNK